MRRLRYSVYLLYRNKSTNTDAAEGIQDQLSRLLRRGLACAQGEGEEAAAGEGETLGA
jgi:hypothetical protein